MRNIFPEYFVNQKPIDFNNLDSSILVVLDTNILLDLYRYSPTLKKKFMNSIKKTEKNLWMPYQVGFEFNRNRKNIIHDIAEEKKNFIPNLSKQILGIIDDSTENFKKKYKMFEEFIESSEKEHNQLISVLNKHFERMDKRINTERSDDILPFIEDVFGEKIASNDLYDYSEWEKEAEVRYKMNKPPGYKDYTKKKDKFYFMKDQRVCSAFGDFFMWKEIIEKSKDDGIKEVILVTRDVKEDWFYETKGKKIGARVELIEELLRVSNTNFRIFTNETFLLNTTSETEYKIVEKEVQDSVVRNNLNELFNLIDSSLLTDPNDKKGQLLLNLDLEEDSREEEKNNPTFSEVNNKIFEIERLIEVIVSNIKKFDVRNYNSRILERVQNLISDYYMYEREFNQLRNEIMHTTKITNYYSLFSQLKFIGKVLNEINSELSIYAITK